MPRSEEAIHRRAAKRQRTVEEQRVFDLKDMRTAENNKKKKGNEENHHAKQEGHVSKGSTSTPSKPTKIVLNESENDPLKEPGAWKCLSCGNENFASRNWCNSKTCNERRPADSFPAVSGWHTKTHSTAKPFRHQQQQQQQPERRIPRHDPQTSKVVVWSKQADRTMMNKNQELRRLYLETNGEGMSTDDVERAKILIARDERKQQKKRKNHNGTEEQKDNQSTPEQSETVTLVLPSSQESTGTVPTTMTTSSTVASPGEGGVDPRIQRKLNKALRKRYATSGGEGMSEENKERVKILMARHERKRQKVLSFVPKE